MTSFFFLILVLFSFAFSSWLPSKFSILILYYIISCRISNLQYFAWICFTMKFQFHLSLLCTMEVSFVRDFFSFFGVTQWLNLYFSRRSNDCGILIYFRRHYRCSLCASPIIHCWEDCLKPSSQTSSYL